MDSCLGPLDSVLFGAKECGMYWDRTVREMESWIMNNHIIKTNKRIHAGHYSNNHNAAAVHHREDPSSSSPSPHDQHSSPLFISPRSLLQPAGERCSALSTSGTSSHAIAVGPTNRLAFHGRRPALRKATRMNRQKRLTNIKRM